jgi:hypothetical protein
MHFFNVLEKKCCRYRTATAVIYLKICRCRAAMDISIVYQFK